MKHVVSLIVDSVEDRLLDAVATVDDAPVNVKRPGIEIHLRSDTAAMVPVLRFFENLDEIRADFAPGASVTLTLEGA